MVEKRYEKNLVEREYRAMIGEVKISFDYLVLKKHLFRAPF